MIYFYRFLMSFMGILITAFLFFSIMLSNVNSYQSGIIAVYESCANFGAFSYSQGNVSLICKPADSNSNPTSNTKNPDEIF